MDNLIPVVTPRERRVSRNPFDELNQLNKPVTPRERRVSRNTAELLLAGLQKSHASREACE